MSTNSTSTSRVVAASPDVVYAALLDPEALLQWLPPAQMTGRFHRFDAREGGGYEMSLYYPADEKIWQGKTNEREDRVLVRFVELRPGRRIVDAITFATDDPAFQGEMHRVTTLEPVPEGTKVTMDFENLPPGLRPEDNAEGARISLDQLASWLASGNRPDTFARDPETTPKMLRSRPVDGRPGSISV